MTRDDVKAAVFQAIREEIDDPDLVLEGGNSAADIPGWDSLTHVRIVMNIGIQIDRDIDPSATYEAANIDELVDAVMALLQG
jgi:acyl carrier protein